MNRGAWIEELFEYLQGEGCKLRHLDLAYNDLNVTHMTNLIKALAKAKSLVSLDL